MTCDAISEKIDAYIDGYLEPDESDRIRDHLDGCLSCRELVSRENKFRQAMRSAMEEYPSPTLTARWFENLTSHQDSKNRGLWVGFSAGGAFAVAVMLLIMLGLPFQTQNQGEQLPGVRVTLNVPETIQLVVSVPQDLQESTITIMLPDNIEFEGLPGQRDITWVADLQAGSNLLALPIVARGTGAGTLVARVTHKNKRKNFKVNLDVGTREQTPRKVRSTNKFSI